MYKPVAGLLQWQLEVLLSSVTQWPWLTSENISRTLVRVLISVMSTLNVCPSVECNNSSTRWEKRSKNFKSPIPIPAGECSATGYCDDNILMLPSISQRTVLSLLQGRSRFQIHSTKKQATWRLKARASRHGLQIRKTVRESTSVTRKSTSDLHSR